MAWLWVGIGYEMTWVWFGCGPELTWVWDGKVWVDTGSYDLTGNLVAHQHLQCAQWWTLKAWICGCLQCICHIMQTNHCYCTIHKVKVGEGNHFSITSSFHKAIFILLHFIETANSALGYMQTAGWTALVYWEMEILISHCNPLKKRTGWQLTWAWNSQPLNWAWLKTTSTASTTDLWLPGLCAGQTYE